MAPPPPVQQNMVPWNGNPKGQTLDSSYSYARVTSDSSRTVIISGHLYHTNQLNAKLELWYKLDGSAPISTGVTFQTNSEGTGDFAYSFGGLTAGTTHTLVIEINLPGQTCYYINASAANDASTGMSFLAD